MMPQREASEQQNEQADQTYGNYAGEQGYTYQQFDTPHQRPLRDEPIGKVYAPVGDNKNALRLAGMAMALITLIVFAVICLVLVGGTGGWISFCAASFAIFLIAAVAIDKIK
jgi:hypothetical protein